MTERVIGLSGKTVEVAAPGSPEDLPAATLTSPGVIKQAIPVSDVQTIPVTDIASAQAAVAAMGTTLSELMQSLRNSGALAESDG